jgi:hypothetical protein
MAAALDVAQQEFVTGEIDRRLAIFNQATTARLQGAVEGARAYVASQFEIEKRELMIASEAMEARILGTIGSSIDERSTALNQNLTEAFAAENAAMPLAVDGMKTVMEAIGGDQFSEMATKMSQLDQSYAQNVSLLTTVFGSSCN